MACVFKPDEAIASLPFIQGKKFALTDLADAKNAGVRVFTSMSALYSFVFTSRSGGLAALIDCLPNTLSGFLSMYASGCSSLKLCSISRSACLG